MNVVLMAILFVLSVVSGMLGIGVAFAALPVLSLYLPDLVNQVQPLSLLLNGFTALFSMIGFAHAGYVDWRKGAALAVVTTCCTPIGAWLSHVVAPNLIWAVYAFAVGFMCWQLLRPLRPRPGLVNFRFGLLMAAPISIVAGFLGVGPGFLLMPALVVVGFGTRAAAGMNALAVTPSSFSAVLPHWSTMQINPWTALPLIAAGAAGSLIGARLATTRIPETYLRWILLAVILGATIYRMAGL
jgi:uncharacterized membrane protein YfcA